jgi:hypothetical protein
MTDPQVDELLADLNRALAVEPSPSVAARVRTSLAADPSAGWFGRRWHVMAVSAATLLIIGVVVWPRVSGVPVPPAAPVASAAVERVAAPAVTPSPRVEARPSSVPVRAERDPEVIVSPGQRLALEQLAAAIREGRISSDPFPAAVAPAPLEVVTISPIVPDVVKIQLSNSGDEASGLTRPRSAR